MRPSDDVPRLLECGVALSLAECSHLAMRVYLHLFWGDGSEKPGFGRCRPGELADVLKSSRRAVVAALDELKSSGLIVWSESEAVAYRPGFANRFNPRDWAHHTNWRQSALRLRDGLIRAQVLEDIGPERKPTSKAACQAAVEATGQQLSASSASSASTISSHAIVADAPASASPPQTSLALEADKQATRAAPQHVLDANACIAAWNEIMRDEVPAKPDKRFNRVYANAVERMGGIESLKELLTWAHADDWHSGRKGTRGATARLAKDALERMVKDKANGRNSKNNGKVARGNAPAEPIGHVDTHFPWMEDDDGSGSAQA